MANVEPTHTGIHTWASNCPACPACPPLASRGEARLMRLWRWLWQPAPVTKGEYLLVLPRDRTGRTL